MSQDGIASHVLARAMQKYIELTAEIPEDWNQQTETLHYNRQRRLLSFMENLARDLSIDDDEYNDSINEAEDRFDPWGGQKEKFKYLSAREEALFKLLSRKNVLQLTRVQGVDDADPLDPREAWGDN